MKKTYLLDQHREGQQPVLPVKIALIVLKKLILQECKAQILVGYLQNFDTSR